MFRHIARSAITAGSSWDGGDWANNVLALGFISVVFGEYASQLFFLAMPYGRVVCSVSVLTAIAIINLIGVRSGSGVQKATSLIKAVALLAFVIVCFVFGATRHPKLRKPQQDLRPQSFLAA